MANELTVGKENMVANITEKGIAELIKPLKTEIHLFDSYVAGTTHLDDKSVLDDIKEGDKLTLRREDNKFDSNAILILDSKERKMGYVPEKDNIIFARLMDAGKILIAKIKHIEPKGSFRMINISIYLVDF